MKVGEANKIRACVNCGKPNGWLCKTTSGANPGRLLRLCDECLRSGYWYEYGLVEREPFIGEVPTEYIEGEWVWPTDHSDPWAVITYSTEPSPETGHIGWMWWALGKMGDAATYQDACAAAVASLNREIADRMEVK